MMQNTKLYILVGVPGSGKSTYANKYLKNSNTVVLSSDELRLEMFGDVNDQAHNQLVFNELFKRMRKLLIAGNNVVVDATNINKSIRYNVLKQVEDLNIQRIAIVLKPNIKKCYSNDLLRERSVGKQVIDKFAKLYEEPTTAEGFNKVKFIKF